MSDETEPVTLRDFLSSVPVKARFGLILHEPYSHTDREVVAVDERGLTTNIISVVGGTITGNRNNRNLPWKGISIAKKKDGGYILERDGKQFAVIEKINILSPKPVSI